MPAGPEDEVGDDDANTERENYKAAEKIPGDRRELRFGERIGRGRDRLLRRLVDSGKRTPDRKTERKQKTHRQDPQPGEEDLASGHGAS
jgi:hypothetical protein